MQRCHLKILGSCPHSIYPGTNGLCRADGKQPDRLTIVLWKCGRSLVWDATCPDTFAPSHILQATREAGAVASAAEVRKRSKYQDLLATHEFVTIAVETSDAFGPEAEAYIRQVGRRLQETSGDPISHAHLLQRVAVTVQRIEERSGSVWVGCLLLTIDGCKHACIIACNLD